MKRPREELRLLRDLPVSNGTVQWLVLRISFWIPSWLGCLTGCLPSAWSDDPLPLFLHTWIRSTRDHRAFCSGQGLKKEGEREPPTLTPQNSQGTLRIQVASDGIPLFLPFLVSLFFKVVLVLFVSLYLLSLCQHYLFLSDWEGNMTDHHQPQGQLLPLTIFGAYVSWETGASSQYTGVVMESGDIWGRRCSPTASSMWGINSSMTCSVWMFPSSPVGQGPLLSSLLW